VLTGAVAVLPVLTQTGAAGGGGSLTKDELALLAELTERIIPKTDTPGAAEAGVPAIIDAGLARNPAKLKQWKAALAWFRSQGRSSAARLKVLERLSTAEKGTEGSEHFALLKGDTIDVYYSTEAGLKTELGWNANTYLSEFPGCTHPEHQS
jgi:hypothetical protein